VPRAIDAKDLDAATRDRLGLTRQQAGEHLQRKRSREGKPRDEHAISQKRKHTGRAFEADLAMTHQQYAFAKWGKLWPHAPPFVRIKGEWMPKRGGGPVDYTGHVTVARLGEKLVGAKLDEPGARVLPVAFDAKVQDAKSAVYHHELKQQHQVHALCEASTTGAVAFLLVLVPQLDPPHGRLIAIDVAAHRRDLLSNHGVRMYEPRRDARADPFLLLPSVALGATRAIAGWDWIPLLDWVTNSA
jgi:hypothetical protein